MVSSLIIALLIIAVAVVWYVFPRRSMFIGGYTVHTGWKAGVASVSKAKVWKLEQASWDNAAQGDSATITDAYIKASNETLASVGITASIASDRTRILELRNTDKPFLETNIKVLTGKISTMSKKLAILTDDEKHMLDGYKSELVMTQAHLAAL